MDDPKPQTEVTEETRETLHLLELERAPRPQKLRLERAFFDGAHEVRFTERTFRPRVGASLDEVRAFVDSLEVKKREVAPLPEPPVAAPVAIPPQVPEHYRAPLEAVVPGALISVETVHRVGTGTVVDVAWENEAEGLCRGLYLVTDEGARPYDAVATDIDALPTPSVAPEAPAEAPPAQPAAPVPQDPKPAKRSLFGRKKDAPATEPPAASDAPAPQEPAPAKRSLFSRKKQEPSEPEASEEPKKRRFGLRRG